MKKEDFTAGQTVYLMDRRFLEFDYRRIEGRIREVKVLTVGRKYITTDFLGGMRFDITNEFRQDTPYSPTYNLYLSREDILNEFKRKETMKEIQENIRHGGVLKRMTYDDLQAIMNIIRKYKPW